MARLIQASRRALLSHSFFTPKTLLPKLNHLNNPISQTRSYISEMRKSTFEGHILRLLRNEIQYENEFAPPKQPAKEYENFTVEECPGEQWIIMRSKNDKEEVKLEVTTFDWAVPSRNAKGEEELELHLSFIVEVMKGGDDGNIIQFICSAWRDSIEVRKVLFCNPNRVARSSYMGPDFNELDEEFQHSLLEFLEERGVTDELAAFLHEYMLNKDKIELLRWMEKVKAFVEK